MLSDMLCGHPEKKAHSFTKLRNKTQLCLSSNFVPKMGVISVLFHKLGVNFQGISKPPERKNRRESLCWLNAPFSIRCGACFWPSFSLVGQFSFFFLLEDALSQSQNLSLNVYDMMRKCSKFQKNGYWWKTILHDVISHSLPIDLWRYSSMPFLYLLGFRPVTVIRCCLLSNPRFCLSLILSTVHLAFKAHR